MLFIACTAITLIVLYDNLDDASAQRSIQNIINTQTTTGGSNAITIHNESRYFHREKCKIYTNITISSVLYNGHKRNNPDGTFYPGDALNYNINVRFDGCSVVKPCRADVIPNTGTECVPLETICAPRRHGCAHGGFAGLGGAGSRSESGTVVIPNGIYGPDESYTVTKKSYAMAKFFGQTKYGAFSGYSLIGSTASFPIRVIDPELSIPLSYAPLTDSDGYIAANLDDTYYVWDPIPIIHKADYKWKDERIGTIFVTHDKTHGILDNIHEFTCDKVLCTHTINGLNGYDSHTLEYGYGGGVTVYNSTCIHGRTNNDNAPTCTAYHGNHNITYESVLYNINSNSGIRTGPERAFSIHNMTSPLIVQYAPEFSTPYPYISLKDDASEQGNWSWSKRHVMAIQYMGSSGGSRDDPDIGPHKHRRALFNMLDYSGNALFLDSKIPIDATLDWSQTAGVSHPDDERCDKYNDTLIDDVFLFGRHNNSAMFTQAGYGRLYMSYEISDFMQTNNVQVAILNNTLQTVEFAGQKLRDLVSYNYTYPGVRFGIPASVVMIDSEGLVKNGSVSAQILPIPYTTKTFAPDTYSGDLQYLHDHICQNVFENTLDLEYPNLVVSDMYPRIMNVRTDTGGRIDFMLNRTGVIFSDIYALFADSTADFDINLIYEAPSAYDFVYGAADENNNRTRTMRSEVTFTSPLLEIANIDNDNILDHTLSCPECSHTTLQVKPRTEFGYVDTVKHNGILVEGLCSIDAGCTLSALKGSDNNVVLTNIWGGTADTTLFVSETDSTSGLSIDIYPILTAIIISIGGLVVWKSFGAIITRFKIMIGAE